MGGVLLIVGLVLAGITIYCVYRRRKEREARLEAQAEAAYIAQYRARAAAAGSGGQVPSIAGSHFQETIYSNPAFDHRTEEGLSAGVDKGGAHQASGNAYSAVRPIHLEATRSFVFY